MNAHIIGYARVSTKEQYLTPTRDTLDAPGVPADPIYVDHSLSGRHRERPGLREAFAAVRTDDTLLVTKLDRLARSLNVLSMVATSSAPEPAKACRSPGPRAEEGTGPPPCRESFWHSRSNPGRAARRSIRTGEQAITPKKRTQEPTRKSCHQELMPA